MKTGIIDEPVNYSKNEDDKLGIKDYAYALKTFIENTETPMTIGVQGEWGSGKTSLMNRLWMELKGDDKNTEIECIWINTWEHSLLKSPEETLISIVGDITDQISSLNPKNTNFTKLKDTGFTPLYSINHAIDEIIDAYNKGSILEDDRWFTVKWMKKINL